MKEDDEFWKSIPESAYPALYERICVRNEIPKKRIPLWFMVKLLWAAWQTEDWFPKPTSSPQPQDEKEVTKTVDLE